MGALYRDFEQTLEVWNRRFAGKPRQEMIHLFLLALEREEIVAVSYRENAIAQRLAAMPIGEDVRELIRHALIWIWKDEEMHSIYIRGAILRFGNFRLKTTAYLRQLAGGVGGWSSSVLMHARWRDAPVSRTFARVATTAGGLLGAIPEVVKSSLEYGSFRQFCEFNVDAEKTAWLCWSRIRQLAEKESDVPATLVADFTRIERDELRHGQLFELLAQTFGENDQLAQGQSAAKLADGIAKIGQEFLPRRMRAQSAIDAPLGSGGGVFVIRGNSSDEKEKLFDRLLNDAGLLAAIDDRAARLGKRRDQMVVAIKPTFMLGYSHRDPSVVTDPKLLDQLARFLRAEGVGDVLAIEGPNIYDEFYEKRSVREVAQYFEFSSPSYRLVDASVDQVEHPYSRGMAQYTVSRTWRDADFRISLGKMRSHPVELAYLTLANIEWLGARCDQFIFCERQAQRETAIMMLLDSCPPHFGILEAWDKVPDGLVGVMGCKKPRAPMRFYAGRDALAVDVVAARHIGVRDPRDSSVLRAAFHWFGADDAHPKVIGCDDPVTPWKSPYHSEVSTFLSLIAYPTYVLGSGRGKLFVPEMDESAFPPLEPPSMPLRAVRRAVQTMIGLRLGR
ncbi:MAG TPA: DUF362 domain-containing protein [Thermoanaerobaculia bacterium]|nr:DUF362 domain-containing protein [Thermoanaerobaculia bacterium]